MADNHDHGHTPAAWTGVIISFVGFCAGGVFMVAAQPVLFWVSMGVILLGALVGGIMKLMGLGAKEDPQLTAARSQAREAQKGSRAVDSDAAADSEAAEAAEEEAHTAHAGA